VGDNRRLGVRFSKTISNRQFQSQSAISIVNLNRQSEISIVNQQSYKSAIPNPQSAMKSVVVHYQEIALKGNNRPWFIARLARNLRQATADLGVREVRVLMGRVEVVLEADADWATVRTRLARVFGVANFAQAGRAPLDVDAIAGAILADLGSQNPRTFRVSARRADKRFPLTSPQIEREVGGRIKEAKGWTVDLDDPELTIHVEALTHDAFYYFGKELGPGGMPVGVSGRVACLLSGGIDSPVAAWRLMRRGCRVLLVHFHSYPILSRASQEKARELARVLAERQFHSRLFLVPFGEIQQQVVLSVPPPIRVVIYRRLMMRIAERIARQNRAQALVTGEVVGQVASQTLENLASINRVVTMPVLRPLIGMDKDEITAEAQRLGTYTISIIPDQDCCTLFTPRHPATKAREVDVERAEATLPVDEIVERAVAAAVVEDFEFPDVK
jgi:thiamine biosynthesis protein ThiI